MESKKELKLKKEVIIGAAVLIALLVVLAFLYIGADKAEKGDTVSVNYAGYLENGTLFDTNIEKIALENGILKDSFESLTFKAGAGELIKGFDNAVIGMSAGDTKRVTILPEDAYPYSEALVLRYMPRISELDRLLEIPESSFNKLFQKAPEIGDVITNEQLPFPIKVLNITDGNVLIETLVKPGDKIKLPGTSWESDVLKISKMTFTIKHNPMIGSVYAMPQNTGFINGNVINVDEDSFDVDTNPPLAGKTLVFDITLVEIKEGN